ncbi:MAG: HD domain-containing protein [Bacteroidetes bacterium]|nr:HD domain-containing protein [Bacteroidota bacterium]
MDNLTQVRKYFEEQKKMLFTNSELLKDSYKFCVNYSTLVEECIYRISPSKPENLVVVAAGSFARRELSPYSDIDIMFIVSELKGNEEQINALVTKFWDCGIEVSHTVRDFSDIERFITNNLASFTQLLETRYLIGSKKIYKEWAEKLHEVITPGSKEKLIYEYFEDVEARHKKYGESPKVLEPNIKFSAGGLRDLHIVGWIYSLVNNIYEVTQEETTHTEYLLELFKKDQIVSSKGIGRLYECYKFILGARNLLHIIGTKKNDRLEFSAQEKIGHYLGYKDDTWHEYMHKYFYSAGILNRFSNTMMKRFKDEISSPISDYLLIEVDNDFSVKGKVIYINHKEIDLSLSDILRAYYYRGLYNARFEERLRSAIIERVIELDGTHPQERGSSVFFREIMNLPRNVGKTLTSMNEVGLLAAFLPEFKDLVGFFQPGVYHCYTADEHTLIALNNLEKLEGSDTYEGKLYDSIRNKDVLFLSVLFHDIAKPISVSGHEILGSEIACSVMERLGYEHEEIEVAKFLVKHHLTMEQIAFRRNLNDPSTLNAFRAIIGSTRELDLLYLVTYADLSAVSPQVWTGWKSDLLQELYRKVKTMILERMDGEELLSVASQNIIEQTFDTEDKQVMDHLKSINDIGYLQQFSQEEINAHVDEIERGSDVSVFFKEESDYTNITVIAHDSYSLLSRLCGALSINDINIHDARIFTRNDNIIIDNFNVSDFRTGEVIKPENYEKIKSDLILAAGNKLQIAKEFNRVKSKWWRIENKFFKRAGKIKIVFEKHEKYTIIDVYSPDRLGLLYQITKKMTELGVSISLAKISTKSDDVVDAFYTLDRNGNKISPNEYELIRFEITEAIKELL